MKEPKDDLHSSRGGGAAGDDQGAGSGGAEALGLDRIELFATAIGQGMTTEEYVSSIELEELGEAKRRAVAQLDALIEMNFEKGDLREARMCIKEKATLLGMIASRFKDQEKEAVKPGTGESKGKFDEKWAQVVGIKKAK